MTGWTAADIPAQAGRRAVVTGANSGLGYQVALQLARHGGHVVLACRSPERGAAAVDRIRDAVPAADVELRLLDLADLDSVRSFAAALLVDGSPLDLLVDNAGIMAPPRRETTAQGFELQFGVNYLGHVALTGLLLPLLADRPGARVVTVSSSLHRLGRIHFGDLQSARRYSPWGAYAQSKLALLMFAFELDRRLRSVGSPLAATAAHPGFALTNLQFAGPGLNARSPAARVSRAVTGGVSRVLAQSDSTGALPLLYAATAAAAVGGAYYGPGGPAEAWGLPREVGSSRRAADPVAADRLWERAGDLTGVGFGVLDTA